MNPTLRGGRLAAVVIGLVALAATACGGGSPDSVTAPGPAAQTRTVVHAMGIAEIIGMPERVVVLDTGELDSVLALGVVPVGAVSAFANGELLSYLGDQARGVEIVGTIAEPNLEAIAALDPDLILSSKARHEDIFGQLSQIAPTVFAERVGVAWKENFTLAGEALGKSAEAERILADYQQLAEQTGQRFGDPAATSISMVRFVGDVVRLYGQGSFIGSILDDAGFARPSVQQVDQTFVEVSREQITQAEGDLMFYASFGAAGVTDQATVTAGPLWQGLPAVAQGRAREVPDDLWYLGIGPTAARLILEELTGYAP